MAIINRRVFFGKVGVADQLVAHLREGEAEFQRHGMTVKSRVLTDFQSGRTDRVVWEWETEDLGELDASTGQVMADPQAGPFFQEWFQKLTELIEYAEVENWQMR